MIEEQTTITLQEFKAWLVGLIRGKGGAIPDLDDWKRIKTMLDKIEEKTDTPVLPYPFPEPNKPSSPKPKNPWDYQQTYGIWKWIDDNTNNHITYNDIITFDPSYTANNVVKSLEIR